MALITVNSYDEFAAYLGKELGKSDWLLIDQDRINKFADATLDHQWIHVDTERAKVESPYHSTIAHGYLTLSLLPHLYQEVIEARNIKMLVNYGMDKMKFGLPVLAGKRVRLSCSLYNIANLRGTAKVEIKFTLEIENERKPALEGIATFLYMFEN
jgi:acyl dehydratase